MIHPSSALIARADTSISDCVRLMKDRNVGSILVVSDNSRLEVVGIFTERDLLNHVDLVQSGGFWSRPIRTIMTQPVVGITIDEIENAPQIMLDGHFRHLPVFLPGEDNRTLAGVVSMRDLFARMTAEKRVRAALPSLAKTVKALPPTGQYGILSKNSDFIEFLKKSISKIRSIRIRELTESELLDAEFFATAKLPFRAIFLDLDDWSTPNWVAALVKLNRNPKIPRVVLFFDPRLHDVKTLKALGNVANSKKFLVFAKPVDVVALLSRVADHLA